MECDYRIQLSRNCYYVFLGLFLIWGIGYTLLSLCNIPLTRFYPIPCTLYSMLGLYCPGCGGTRAVEALMKGQFIKSFCYHPVVLYTAVFMCSYVVTHTLNILTKGRCKAMLFRPIYFYIMIGIIVLQWVIKNVFVIFGGVYLIG